MTSLQVYRLSEKEIGCSLAEAAEKKGYEAWLRRAAADTPRSMHVVYINTSLVTKALSQVKRQICLHETRVCGRRVPYFPADGQRKILAAFREIKSCVGGRKQVQPFREVYACTNDGTCVQLSRGNMPPTVEADRVEMEGSRYPHNMLTPAVRSRLGRPAHKHEPRELGQRLGQIQLSHAPKSEFENVPPTRLQTQALWPRRR